MLVTTKQLTGAIDFNSMKKNKNTMEVNGYRQLFWWLPTFFKISSFVFNRRKQFIQVWNIFISIFHLFLINYLGK